MFRALRPLVSCCMILPPASPVGIWTVMFDVEENEANPLRDTGQLIDVCGALS